MCQVRFCTAWNLLKTGPEKGVFSSITSKSILDNAYIVRNHCLVIFTI